MSLEARELLSLFEGSSEAHGTYRSDGTTALAGKVEIKSSARTLREPVTEALWDEHLSGTTPLGIIPLRSDDTVVWACGDIDQYDISHTDLVAKIRHFKLPLIVTRSKSGGAHVFLFLSRPSEPVAIQAWMRHQMARIGWGACEIFPKQTRVLRERGDLGNWIVMPYFGQTQEAVRPSGGAMTAAEFIREAQRLRQDPAELRVPKANGAAASGQDVLLGDGPPCLQHLCSAGFAEGTRNKGLFALGIYCRKRWPSEWERHLEDFNQSAMRPPLTSDEVSATIKSLRKRDYQYKCTDIPLVNHCNAPLCQTRLYGVGGDGGAIPTISSLSVLESDPPVWFLDIADQRLELSTDELLTFRLFQKRCAETQYQVWRTLKQETWMRMVSKAMETCSRIAVPEEVGKRGKFREVLSEFCTNRTQGLRPEDLFSRRVWVSQEDGRYYFRLQDLEKMVDNSGMTMDRGELVAGIKALGGERKFINVKGRGINTWWVEQDVLAVVPATDPPPLKPEVM